MTSTSTWAQAKCTDFTKKMKKYTTEKVLKRKERMYKFV